MHSRPLARIGAVILVCLLALPTALIALAAHSQGITLTAKPPSASTPADVAAMKLRVDELERRVQELEKEKADQVEADESEDAADKKLEQRLAAIETAQRDEAASDKAAPSAESPRTLGPQKVRAPFVVVDDDGNALVTVDRGQKHDGARLTVGDLTGSSVGLFVTSALATVQVMDQTDKPRVELSVTPQHQLIATFGPNGTTLVGSNNEKIAVVQVLNKANYPIAEMRGMPESQGGQMSIANASGNKLMIVQETNNGVGILRMGPSNNGMAPAMQNQGLPGGGLSGKKD
jgi:hypothetical protein